MRFLIDENLSPMLVDLARERGYETMTLRDLGVLNAKDWTLLEKIQNEDWTLVINNVQEIRKRYAHGAVLHAGAVFLADVDSGRDVQRLAFALAVNETLIPTRTSSFLRRSPSSPTRGTKIERTV
jgi:hypothetical protein